MFNNEGNAIVTNLDKVNEKIKETNENSLNDMKSAYSTAFKSITEDDQTMWEEIKNAKDGLYQDADVMKKVDPSITIDNGGLYWGGGNFTGIEKYKYFLELQKEGVTLTEETSYFLASNSCCSFILALSSSFFLVESSAPLLIVL